MSLSVMQKSNRTQIGFGLIELMVAITIGLIVIGGITSLVVATLRTNTDQYQMTRLTQDLRASMTLITRELKRAGYDEDAIYDFGRGSHTSNNFEDVRLFDDDNTTELFVEDGIASSGSGGNPATCVIYGWDADGDGAGDAGEYRGFRLDAANGTLEAKTSGAEADADCNAGNWEALTDPNLIQVDQFEITTVDGLEAPQVKDAAGNTILTVRELVISLEGSIGDDTSISREMRETVRVRNDIFN